MRHEYLENQVWERAWMDYYEPIQIGEKYWIVPEWLEPPESDATKLNWTQVWHLVQVTTTFSTFLVDYPQWFDKKTA